MIPREASPLRKLLGLLSEEAGEEAHALRVRRGFVGVARAATMILGLAGLVDVSATKLGVQLPVALPQGEVLAGMGLDAVVLGGLQIYSQRLSYKIDLKESEAQGFLSEANNLE